MPEFFLTKLYIGRVRANQNQSPPSSGSGGQPEIETETVPPEPIPTDYGEGIPNGGGRVNLKRRSGRLR